MLRPSTQSVHRGTIRGDPLQASPSVRLWQQRAVRGTARLSLKHQEDTGTPSRARGTGCAEPEELNPPQLRAAQEVAEANEPQSSLCQGACDTGAAPAKYTVTHSSQAQIGKHYSGSCRAAGQTSRYTRLSGLWKCSNSGGGGSRKDWGI